MAFTSSIIDEEPRAWSIGPWKVEVHYAAADSGDGSGTINAVNLSQVIAALPSFVCDSVTLDGKAVTLGIPDLTTSGVTSVGGYVILIGR